MSVNKVTLLGNVGKAEIRESQNGKYATMSLATTDRGYMKKDGTQVPERTEWHNLVVNGGLVSVVEKYVTKGTKLYIEGKLRTRKYTDKSNAEKYVTEIYVDQMELLGSRAEQPAQQPQQVAQPTPFNQQEPKPYSTQPTQISFTEDDGLPF